ncbi:MAG TPA: hypothetical protein VNK05_11665 [Chloroflexota bacterium]|nr:hypothetical protein [Chloroflexota bacterium]
MKQSETKKTYRRPTLVEYGRMADLTRGIFGSAPDCVGFLNVGPAAPAVLCESRSS